MTDTSLKANGAEARFALARTRVFVTFALGAAAFGISVALTAWQVAILVGWDTAAAVSLAWTFSAVWHRDSGATAALATREDNSRALADVLLVSAAVASLVAIGVALVKAGSAQGAAEAVITGLGILTVVLSWAVVHMVYTLRYAHLYYAQGGGIDFNENADPDYRDFVYVALTIGMTFQVSDTDLTSKPIRRVATRHALLSYMLGAVVIAMAINVIAGLLNR
jgi:uncharacterized membrane protein